jgi:2',3'-cyclic-nucleotide 2'-phosphodiesterase (5'-nucleotidase family)
VVPAVSIQLLHVADLENAYDHPERIARLAGAIADRREGATLVTGGGDDLAAGVLPTVTGEGWRVALPFFEAVGADVDTVGNHDLDDGLRPFLDAVRDTPQRWVCANLRQESRPVGEDAGVEPWSVFERAGERVGVFGVAHPETPALAPAAAALAVDDPVAAALDAVDSLRELGVDHVVGLTHLGDDDDLARAVDADVLLGGHRHERRVDRVAGTLLVRTAGNGRELAAVTLGDEPTATVLDVAAPEPDPAVLETYRTRWREAGLDEVIATAETPVERTYETRFHGESRVGNLVADAYRWATGADVGVATGGAIRMGPPLAGEVTVGDVVGVVPHDDPLTVGTIRGRDILDVLSVAEGGGPADEPHWWHLHLSGASVVWDHAAGEVVEARAAGDPVDPDRTYAVATSAFLFSIDAYPQLCEENRGEDHGAQYETVVAYARVHGVDVPVDGRIERRNLPAGDEE